MLRFLLVVWLLVPLPAFAACQGVDLRPTLTADEHIALEALLRDRPYAEGNHWVATKDGKTLHLIGTMHLADPRFDAIATRLAPLIAGADTVLLEMTAKEEADLTQAMTRDPSLLVLTESALPDLLGPDWDALAIAMQARGMPPFMVAKFRPWYVAMLLAMPACLDLQSAAKGGLDALIEDMATKANIPTRALEPFDTAIAAFGRMPLDMQVEMLRASLVPDGVADDLFATLSATYFDEAHAQSWAITEVLSPRFGMLTSDQSTVIFETMDAALLSTRNAAWIPVLQDALAGAKGPVVAAFGAAHLNGHEGVLALLEKAGFDLERRPF